MAADAIERTVETARTQLNRIRTALVRQLSADADVIRVRQDAARASTSYQNIQAEKLAGLRATLRAKAQAAAVVDLDVELERAKDQAKMEGKITTDTMISLAARLLAARTEISRGEAARLQSDETVQRYHYAQIDAAARLAEVEADVASRIPGDANWQAAKATLERARGQMASLTD